jgi:uncharacterized coiled-coil protein SlyX
MAQSDAKIKYLEHEIDEQEKLITMMEISGSGGATEDRIVALEKKVRDMEALVKGLTQELLDLKAVAMKMSKQTEEAARARLKVGPVAQGAQSPQPTASGGGTASGSTVIRPKGARQPDVPATPQEPVMDMIMQQDGTMKLEPRRGDKDYIIARAGYGQKKGGKQAKQGDLIYAAEEKPKSDPANK